MRMIWTGAGRTLPSDDLNSGSTTDATAPLRDPNSFNRNDYVVRPVAVRASRPAGSGSSLPPVSALSPGVSLLGGRSSRRGRRRGVLGVLLSALLASSAVFSASPAAAAPKPALKAPKLGFKAQKLSLKAPKPVPEAPKGSPGAPKPRPEAPKPTLKQVERRVEKLNEQAEQATESFLDTRETLKSINVRLGAAHTKLARQRVELAKSQAKLGKLAAESYRRGELSALGLVLGDNPELQLAQAGYLPSLGERQAGAMNRLKAGERKLAATETEIKKQKAKAEAAKAMLIRTRAMVTKRLAQADVQLRSLRPGDRRTVTNSMNSAGVPEGGGGSALCNDKSVNAATAAGRTAIVFACNQLGESYVWAGAGPAIWDCSGLTMAAFAAAGVTLPHSSGQQANFGTRIDNSSIQAGDLLFFNRPISHVGISLGDNLMVHAPHSGDVVKVVSLYDTPSVVVRL
jgi:peptidoglycan DL-endopeptidase CwlO